MMSRKNVTRVTFFIDIKAMERSDTRTMKLAAEVIDSLTPVDKQAVGAAKTQMTKR